MTNAHSFLIRLLPFLAQELVIQHMMIKEQLEFSTLSRRSKWIVYTSTSRQKFDMRLNFQKSVEVTIANQRLTQCHRFELTGTLTYPTISEMAELISSISGSFKNLSVSLQVWGGGPYRSIFELVPVIKKLNVSLNRVVMFCSSNDKLCEDALQVAKNAKELHIACKTSPNFQPPELEVFELEFLCVSSASWISLDHLLNNFMNCHEISLSGSNMSIRDVNKFIRKWMEGSKMKSFRWMPTISLHGVSVLLRVLDGIPCVAVKKVTFGLITETFEDNECFMIEQIGGAKAIVYKGFHPVVMTTEFSMN